MTKLHGASLFFLVDNRTLRIASAAYHKGLHSVISAAFESSIALSHMAILASVLWSDQCFEGHGLGTYEAMADDVVGPPPAKTFGDLVSENGTVQISACEALLNAFTIPPRRQLQQSITPELTS